eukprot:TRINITY_DN5024_c0_g1_i2.p1 TRINITY_DN5024_c0_g1~~TRINITY_DN5024_c0_g1_i2.p1  ORF type:complete len:148 (-),score=11.59 TRINITY_DN5024_c0_g1_i2:475-918(-)
MFVRIGDVRQQHSRSRSSLIDLHQTLAARVGRVTGRPSQVDLCQTSDLEVALGAPSVRRDFLEFLKTQRSTENLMFWDEVQRYKKIRDGSDKQITEAIMIYQKCIHTSSIYFILYLSLLVFPSVFFPFLDVYPFFKIFPMIANSKST